MRDTEKYKVSFFKDRQKFSAAHFTLFEDGAVERLHGHNYQVKTRFHGSRLSNGLLFPFHALKRAVSQLCETWDEKVLLPLGSPWVHLEETPGQCEVRIQTSRVKKFYSFPREDVTLLDCDNVSCENLARLFAERLASYPELLNAGITGLEVTIAESAGQTVTYVCPIPLDV